MTLGRGGLMPALLIPWVYQSKDAVHLKNHDRSHTRVIMQNILTPGDRVRAARKHYGWSQQSLADRADLSRQTVKLVEGGYAGSRATREAIAAALDLSHDDLFAPVK